jgi:molybdate transport system ATP-binding protein
MDRLELDIELARDEFRLAVSDTLDLTGTTAIFGANGSGKTSLLRVIAGLEPAARGTIRFRGAEWQGPGRFEKPEHRAIGFVFQDGRLFSHLDVAGNLRFPQQAGGRAGSIGFDETVDAFGLGDLLHRHTGSLSGGERQRVAIARALLAAPSLLLMDEPLSSLDRSRKAELLPLIRELPARFGIPILLVTHDIDELVYLSDSVVLLADGTNVARGSAREILERSDFEQLQARIARHADGMSVIELDTGILRIPQVAGNEGEIARLRIQPRDVVLALEPIAGISIRNCLPVTVRALERLPGEQVLVHLDVGNQRLKARVTAEAARELALAEGLDIYALIKAVVLDPLPST